MGDLLTVTTVAVVEDLLAVVIVAVLLLGFLFLYNYLGKKFSNKEEEDEGAKEESGLTPQKVAAITACISLYYSSCKQRGEYEEAEFIVKSIKKRYY